MWATIAMQMFYMVSMMVMSFYFKKQNEKADADSTINLEGVKSFRYAP
jgi:hypothetical protein